MSDKENVMLNLMQRKGSHPPNISGNRQTDLSPGFDPDVTSEPALALLH